MPWYFQCENYCDGVEDRHDPSGPYPGVYCRHCGQECCENCIEDHEAGCRSHVDCDCEQEKE